RVEGAGAGIENGALVARANTSNQGAEAVLRLLAPIIYQDTGAGRRKIAGSWEALGRDEFGFRVGAYDRRAPLVIDPGVVYSTYLGGIVGEAGEGIAVDSRG